MNFFRIAARIASNREATDRSFAESIRNLLVEEIHRQMPNVFEIDLYDTNPRGKGFAAGYVSFGLRPMAWMDADLIGGILVKGNYDEKNFRSEKPEDQPEWAGHSKGHSYVTVSVQGGYYNKLRDGGVKNPREIGELNVLVAKDESLELVDVDNMVSAFQDIIKSVVSNPPEEALSAARKRLPGNPKAMIRWLSEQGRNSIKQSEIDYLAKKISDEQGRAQGTVRAELEKLFRSNQMTIDKNA